MNNDYGCYNEDTGGVLHWVKTQVPLELSTDPDEAIDNWSYADACAVATYLTNSQGVSFAPGRPGDRQPH